MPPVPDEFDVYFDDDEPPIRCSSLSEVDRALDRLHNQHDPADCPLAIAIKVFGHEIDMGLGVDATFLCLQIDPCDGEYYLAVGAEAEGEAKMFYGAGQDSYWRPRHLIPMAVARSAVRHFIQYRKRSPAVRWQDWEGREV